MSSLSIANRQKNTAPSVSFEFFPPKSEAMATRLWETVQRLEPMAPEFVSVTYGAGGSTRERTHDTVKRIASDTALRPAAHLTCVSATKGEVLDVADSYAAAGVHPQPRLVLERRELHTAARETFPEVLDPGDVNVSLVAHPGDEWAAGAQPGLQAHIREERIERGRRARHISMRHAGLHQRRVAALILSAGGRQLTE